MWKWKTHIQYYGKPNNLRARFKVPEWGAFCHYGCYKYTLLASTEFNMTVPNHFPYDASVDVDGFSRVHDIIRIHRALQSCH